MDLSFLYSFLFTFQFLLKNNSLDLLLKCYIFSLRHLENSRNERRDFSSFTERKGLLLLFYFLLSPLFLISATIGFSIGILSYPVVFMILLFVQTTVVLIAFVLILLIYLFFFLYFNPESGLILLSTSLLSYYQTPFYAFLIYFIFVVFTLFLNFKKSGLLKECFGVYLDFSLVLGWFIRYFLGFMKRCNIFTSCVTYTNRVYTFDPDRLERSRGWRENSATKTMIKIPLNHYKNKIHLFDFVFEVNYLQGNFQLTRLNKIDNKKDFFSLRDEIHCRKVMGYLSLIKSYAVKEGQKSFLESLTDWRKSNSRFSLSKISDDFYGMTKKLREFFEIFSKKDKFPPMLVCFDSIKPNKGEIKLFSLHYMGFEEICEHLGEKNFLYLVEGEKYVVGGEVVLNFKNVHAPIVGLLRNWGGFINSLLHHNILFFSEPKPEILHYVLTKKSKMITPYSRTFINNTMYKKYRSDINEILSSIEGRKMLKVVQKMNLSKAAKTAIKEYKESHGYEFKFSFESKEDRLDKEKEKEEKEKAKRQIEEVGKNVTGNTKVPKLKEIEQIKSHTYINEKTGQWEKLRNLSLNREELTASFKDLGEALGFCRIIKWSDIVKRNPTWEVLEFKKVEKCDFLKEEEKEKELEVISKAISLYRNKVLDPFSKSKSGGGKMLKTLNRGFFKKSSSKEEYLTVKKMLPYIKEEYGRLSHVLKNVKEASQNPRGYFENNPTPKCGYIFKKPIKFCEVIDDNYFKILQEKDFTLKEIKREREEKEKAENKNKNKNKKTEEEIIGEVNFEYERINERYSKKIKAANNRDLKNSKERKGKRKNGNEDNKKDSKSKFKFLREEMKNIYYEQKKIMTNFYSEMDKSLLGKNHKNNNKISLWSLCLKKIKTKFSKENGGVSEDEGIFYIDGPKEIEGQINNILTENKEIVINLSKECGRMKEITEISEKWMKEFEECNERMLR